MEDPRIARQRLHCLSLSEPRFSTPEEVVSHLGAVQAQEYAAAKWALALRTPDANEAQVEGALASGRILRTHVLRPTWHFVAPADIRWMLALTAPRVRTACAYQWRQLQIDEKTFSRASRIMEKVLSRHGHLTRPELFTTLRRAGIEGDALRLGHLLIRAELDAVICSGPRHGKQATYALLEERVPPAANLTRDEALGRLALLYFKGHGPATIHDFAWWSGLTVKDCRKAVEISSGELESHTRNEQAWFSAAPENTPITTRRTAAYLLPCYDEFMVGYTTRDVIPGAAQARQLLPRGDLLGYLVVAGTRIVGTWNRPGTGTPGTAPVLQLFSELSAPERAAVSRAVRRYSEYQRNTGASQPSAASAR